MSGSRRTPGAAAKGSGGRWRYCEAGVIRIRISFFGHGPHDCTARATTHCPLYARLGAVSILREWKPSLLNGASRRSINSFTSRSVRSVGCWAVTTPRLPPTAGHSSRVCVKPPSGTFSATFVSMSVSPDRMLVL